MKRKRRLARLDLTAAVGHPAEKSSGALVMKAGMLGAIGLALWLLWWGFS